MLDGALNARLKWRSKLVRRVPVQDSFKQVEYYFDFCSSALIFKKGIEVEGDL